jgi:hypothetical protein
MNLHAERRAVGRGRANGLLADAELANDVKRYRQDRRETMDLIERLESRPGRGAAIICSGRSTEHTLRCEPKCPSWTGQLGGFTRHTIATAAAKRAGMRYQAIDGSSGGVVLAAQPGG